MGFVAFSLLGIHSHLFVSSLALRTRRRRAVEVLVDALLRLGEGPRGRALGCRPKWRAGWLQCCASLAPPSASNEVKREPLHPHCRTRLCVSVQFRVGKVPSRGNSPRRDTCAWALAPGQACRPWRCNGAALPSATSANMGTGPLSRVLPEAVLGLPAALWSL